MRDFVKSIVDGAALLEEIWPQNFLVNPGRTIIGHRGEAPGKENYLGQPVEWKVPETKKQTYQHILSVLVLKIYREKI